MFHRHFDNHMCFCHDGGFATRAVSRWRSAAAASAGGKAACSTAASYRLVILALVAEKPRYGYEIIKELGERVGGDYRRAPASSIRR